METPVIAVVVGVIAIALMFIVLRRVMRLAIRLVLVGVILLVLLVGGVVWWWNNGSSDSSAPGNRPGTTRRGNSR
jgi:high-affinity Fe2+/Pb2+ permease